MAKVTRLTLDNNGGLERRRLHLHEIAEADAPLDTVGQDLRKARQRKGEDLAQVSATLKIRKDHLDAIEESEFDKLPGRTYAIGFVRTYADYLGLDQAQCIERLKAEIAGRSENKESNVQISQPSERTLPKGWLILAAVLVISLAYGGYYLVVSANRTAGQTLTPVPERLAAQAGLPEAAAAPLPQPAPEAPLPLPIQSAPAIAVPPPSLEASAPSVDSGPLPQGQKFGAGNANSRVTLRIHREGRITVTGANNFVYLGRQLRRGDSYQVPNLSGLKLSVTDAGAVELIVDGNSLGFAGQDGVAADDLSLNAQEILDRRRGAG